MIFRSEAIRAWRAAALIPALLALCSCEDTMALLFGVERMAAEELHRRMVRGDDLLLMDSSADDTYRQAHIAGALSLDPPEVNGYLSRVSPPRTRTVVTVCQGGHTSLWTGAIALGLGYERVFSLGGGMAAWQARRLPTEGGPGPRVTPAEVATPVVAASWFEQLVSTTSGLVIKPIYMLLSLGIILVLRRQRARDLTLMRRSMAFFLVGESACALNFLVGAGMSDSLELVHGLGMLAMGALLPWGLFRWLDDRVLRLSDPKARCALQRFCGHCYKHEQITCGLKRLFLFVAPALALVALIPWSTPLRTVHVVIPVFGTDVDWAVTPAVALLEFRLYPALAALLLVVTTLRLIGGEDALQRAQGPFFWGLGLTSFALLKYFFLLAFARMPVWADWWEELTELLSVLGLSLFLYLFRSQLGLGQSTTEMAAASDEDDAATASDDEAGDSGGAG